MSARSIVTAASLLCSLLWVPAAAAAPPALFDASTVGADASAARSGAGRASVRQRAVTARLGLLARADGSPALGVGDRVELNLFDDVSFSMLVTDVSGHLGRGHSWSGVLDGVDLGSAVLAVQDGVLVGHIVSPGGVYNIGHLPDGTQVVERIETGALPPEAAPIAAATRGADAMRLGGESLDVAGDTAALIDVMVLYTAAARVAAGGTGNIQAYVSAAVASANQAYANNNLTQRLRLVYAGETSVVESANITDALGALKTSPTVGWLRDVTRADLVTLLADHGPSFQFCGVSFMLETNSTSFAPFAFSVVERRCATANFSFAHELAHNMGAHHDLFVAPNDHTVFPYSHGWVDLVTPFRTILSYENQCLASGFTCNRIPFFSTPDQTQAGRPLGNAVTADNARTLGDTAASVANFSQALTPPLALVTGVQPASVGAGETLVASVSLDNVGVAAGTADIYVGLLLPDGSAAFFTSVAITPTSGYAFGSVTDFASYRPIATGVSLATPFSASFPSFLSYQRKVGDPAGGLTFFLLVVTAGALDDGVLSPGELLATSVTPFTFPAAAGGGTCVGPICIQ
jgi:hypothetical protein